MSGKARAPLADGLAALGLTHAAEIAVWSLSECSSAVIRSRDLVRGAFTVLGLSPEAVDDGVVMVSELVTNALRHACAPYELRLYRDRENLVCEVVDGSETLPEIPPPGTHLTLLDIDAITDVERLETGRGLDVVYQLSDGRCAAHPTKTRTTSPVVSGKGVAFVLRIPDGTR